MRSQMHLRECARSQLNVAAQIERRMMVMIVVTWMMVVPIVLLKSMG